MSLVNHDYDLYFASEDFLTGGSYENQIYDSQWSDNFYGNSDTRGGKNWTNRAPYWITKPAQIQAEIMQKDSPFERLDTKACIDAYAVPFVTDRSNVVLISNPISKDVPYKNVNLSTSLWYITYKSQDHAYSNPYPYAWMCDRFDSYPEDVICNKTYPTKQAAAGDWIVKNFNITGCSSQKVKELCSVKFHLGIGITVILANLGKAICMAVVCVLVADRPILTIGDAVTSFLRTPDRSTRGRCLWSKEDFRRHWHTGKSPVAKQYEPISRRRWRAAGRGSWAIFLLLYVTVLWPCRITLTNT